MKKTLYLLIVSILFLGNMGFASADPITHGTIDGITEIDIPMEEVPELCVPADYTYGDWNTCLPNNTQTRTYTKINSRCLGGFIPTLTQACTYTSPTIPNGNTGGGGGGYPFWLFQTVTNPVVPQVLGEKISFTDGRWVKTSDSKTVYFVDSDNVRHAYPNQNIWKSYFGNDFSFVEIITKEELASYPLDRNVSYKAGAMFKISSIPKVYRVGEDRLIQWIKTEDTAKRLHGDNWNKLVQDLPDGFFGDYVIGEDLE